MVFHERGRASVRCGHQVLGAELLENSGLSVESRAALQGREIRSIVLGKNT